MARIIIIAASPNAYAAGIEVLTKKLEDRGFQAVVSEDITLPPSSAVEDVFGLVAGVQAKCDSGIMDRFPHLKIISPFGIGFDHIDLEAAHARDIIVTNAPAVSNFSVAELTIAFIVALARGIIDFNQSMKRGEWKRTYGLNLKDKCLGIIGLGSIGREVAKLALAFGMEVSAFDVVYNEEFLASHPVVKKEFTALLRESDFITIHVPSNVETKYLLDKAAFSIIKHGAYVINTARGDIVDIPSLLTALESGMVAGAALDVFPVEPPENPILQQVIRHPKVIATPHIAAVSPEIHAAVGERIFQNISAVAEGRTEHIDRVN